MRAGGGVPVEPTEQRALAELVRRVLAESIGEVEEYGLGRFGISHAGFDVTVLVSERDFPSIRIEHRVMEVPDPLRPTLIEFANSLHGRSSTTAAHWWLGDQYLWQVATLWAWRFDGAIFLDQLSVFMTIVSERTPEIRARFSGGRDS